MFVRKISLALLVIILSAAMGNASAAAPSNAAAEARVKKLFENLVDLKKKESWACFTEEASQLLQKLGKPKVADVFKELKTETSALKIGAKLKPFQNELPKDIKAILDKQSTWELMKIVNDRVANNQKVSCNFKKEL